jgi:hypothetical protein
MLTLDPFQCHFDLQDGSRVLLWSRSGNRGRGRWWMTPSDQIRMLPRELPRDPFHGEIINAAIDGRLQMRDLPQYFIPPVLHAAGSGAPPVPLHPDDDAGRLPTDGQPDLHHSRRDAGSTLSDEPGVGRCLGREAALPLPLHRPPRLPGGGLGRQAHAVAQGRWRLPLLLYFGEQRPLAFDAVHGKWYQKQGEGPYPGHLTLYLWGMENEESQMEGDDASFYLTLDFEEMLKHDLDLEKYIDFVITDDSKAHSSAPEAPDLIREAMGIDLPEDPFTRKRLTESIRRTLRIIFNALLYLGSESPDLETDPITVKAEKERVEYTEVLRRLKSPRKRKRVEKKLEDLPNERVIWIGRSTLPERERSDRTQDQPGRRTWVRGHWWPRKDTVRRKLRESSDQVESLQCRVRELRQLLQEADSTEERASTLTSLLPLEDDLADAKANHEDLEAHLNRKLRWVMPHLRNKDSEEEVKGHTYRL